jgi:3-hydroxyisobutyrate dehydrogenase-like beta-hydroxyacid dehydrogenase
MKVAVLGLGIIGSAWAKNLQDDGLEVRCWNRSKKNFPGFEPDAAKAVEGADFVFIVVADPPAVEAVLNQILPKLKKGQVIIQSSTISAKWSKQFAGQVQKTGADFLEAPFTGSKPAAEKRETIFYLGGDSVLIEKARPVLERIGKQLIHVGPLGSASSLKLAMNINIANVAQGLCEALSFARQEGISDEMFWQCLQVNASKSGTAEMKMPKLQQRDFSPQFSVKHMGKDLRLALESAADLPLTQTRALAQTYEEGIKRGWQEEDLIALIRLAEKK